MEKDEELVQVYGEPSILTVAKAGRIRWLRHVMTMPGSPVQHAAQGSKVVIGKYHFFWSRQDFSRRREERRVCTGKILRTHRLRISPAIMDFKAINDRLCTLSMRGKFFNISVVV